MFCIAFTRRHKRQVKATCYAKDSQQKLIRTKLERPSQRNAPRSSHLRMCSSRRSRSSRSPSSILPSLWSSTPRELRRRRLLLSKSQRTPSHEELASLIECDSDATSFYKEALGAFYTELEGIWRVSDH